MQLVKTRFARILSVVLSSSLVLTSLSLADVAHASAPVTPVSQFAAQLAIPDDLGFVTDAYVGKDSKTAQVIFLQDLHLHYSTQQRILAILNHLYAKNLVSGPVAIEGLQGDYDTSLLASYPAGKTKTKLIDYFMSKGELSGDEAFAVLRGENHRLFGVDDGKFYQLNRELYKGTLENRHVLQGQLVRIQKEVNVLKKEHYTRALRKLDRLPAYDTASAEALLQEKLSAAQKAKQPEVVANLVQIDHSLSFLNKLLRQETTLDEVRYVAQRLPQFVELTHKLLEMQSSAVQSKTPILETVELEETLKSAVDFYAVALMRDEPLAKHTLEMVKAQGTVVLVAGGFHTAGVTRELKKAGIGYAVVTPVVKDEVGEEYHQLYEKRIAGQSLTIEEVANDFHVQPVQQETSVLRPQTQTLRVLTSLSRTNLKSIPLINTALRGISNGAAFLGEVARSPETPGSDGSVDSLGGARTQGGGVLGSRAGVQPLGTWTAKTGFTWSKETRYEYIPPIAAELEPIINDELKSFPPRWNLWNPFAHRRIEFYLLDADRGDAHAFKIPRFWKTEIYLSKLEMASLRTNAAAGDIGKPQFSPLQIRRASRWLERWRVEHELRTTNAATFRPFLGASLSLLVLTLLVLWLGDKDVATLRYHTLWAGAAGLAALRLFLDGLNEWQQISEDAEDIEYLKDKEDDFLAVRAVLGTANTTTYLALATYFYELARGDKWNPWLRAMKSLFGFHRPIRTMGGGDSARRDGQAHLTQEISELIKDSEVRKTFQGQTKELLTEWLHPFYQEDHAWIFERLTKIKSGNDAERKTAVAELNNSFFKRLEPGTAGIRGPRGRGPNRINKFTIGRFAYAKAKYMSTQAFTDTVAKEFRPGFHSGIKKAGVEAFDPRFGSQEIGIMNTMIALATQGDHRALDKVYFYSFPRTTPQLSWSVNGLVTHAENEQIVTGNMDTASHNPASDTGTKPYKPDGSQVTGDIYLGIMDNYARVTPEDLQALTYHGVSLFASQNQAAGSDDEFVLPEGIQKAFENARSQGEVVLVGGPSDAIQADAQFIESQKWESFYALNDGTFDRKALPAIDETEYYVSPLWGSGKQAIMQIFKMRALAEQNTHWFQDTPSGAFRGDDPETASPKPNPELPAARLAMIKHAIKDRQNWPSEKRNRPVMLLWVDPDTDRPALAILKDPTKDPHQTTEADFAIFNGNQQLTLMADYFVTQLERFEKLRDTAHPTPENLSTMTEIGLAMVNNLHRMYGVSTVVSGDLMKDILRKKGIDVRETLVGFKYVGDVIEHEIQDALKAGIGMSLDDYKQKSKVGRLQALLQEGLDTKAFLFGGEESLGFASGDTTHDKNAVVAASWFPEIAAYWSTQGMRLDQRLEQIYQKYGYLSEPYPMPELAQAYPIAGSNDTVKFSEAEADEIIGKVRKGQVLMNPDLTILGSLRAGVKKGGIEKIAGKKIIAVVDYQSQEARDLEGRLIYDVHTHQGFFDARTAPASTDAQHDFKARLQAGGIPGVSTFSQPYGEALPQENFIVLLLEDGSKVIPRPSGTEPKIKYYVLGRGSYAQKEQVDQWVERAKTFMIDYSVSIARQRFPARFPSIELEILEISVRRLNALRNGGIRNLPSLTAVTEEKLGKVKGIGKKGVVEIKEALASQGLSLRKENMSNKRAAGPEETAWNAVEDHYNQVWRDPAKRPHLRDMFAQDPERAHRFFLNALGVNFDYSKHLITDETLRLLLQLANATGLRQKIEDMFTGKKINNTENRAVLHVALRAPKDEVIMVDGENVVPQVHAVLDHMTAFSNQVRSGKWLGYSKKPIRNIVNIGIGGSDLGPVMAYEALKPYSDRNLTFRFVSNVDGTDFAEATRDLDPKETLFIIASKTFTTGETIRNAKTAREWVLKAYGGNTDAIAKHFVAVSTAAPLVKEFGIDTANMFEFWDWVGGRYSMESAVGLSTMLAIGPENYQDMLAGFHDMDVHYRTAPFEKNLPVLMALLSIWYINFFNSATQAVLPYDQYSKRFAAYLQQLVMESNGKGVTKDGKPVTRQTGEVLMGEPGTNGQHSFYQEFHQGRVTPVDFLGFANTHNPLGNHHDILNSNAIGQPAALAMGKTLEEVMADGKTSAELAPHKVFEGNRPSSVLVMDTLTPRVLGMLVALYEHRVATQSFIWDINAFDQWGVELGKVLANQILPVLEGKKTGKFDSSTMHLIEIFKRLRRNASSAVPAILAVVTVGWGYLWASAAHAQSIAGAAAPVAASNAAFSEALLAGSLWFAGIAIALVGTYGIIQVLHKLYVSHVKSALEDKKLKEDSSALEKKIDQNAEIQGMLEHIQQHWKQPSRWFPSLVSLQSIARTISFKDQTRIRTLLEQSNLAIVAAA